MTKLTTGDPRAGGGNAADDPILAVGAGGEGLRPSGPDRPICQCPCGVPLPAGAHGRRRYISHAHAQRAYVRRIQDAAEAAGLPVVLSRATLNLAGTTRQPSPDAEIAPQTRERHSRSGRQVSYAKGVAAVAAGLGADLNLPIETARTLAARWLGHALPEQQRGT